MDHPWYKRKYTFASCAGFYKLLQQKPAIPPFPPSRLPRTSHETKYRRKMQKTMEIKERTCILCGKPFLPYNQNQVYCSPECSTLGGDRSERENRRYQTAVTKAQSNCAKLETKQQLSISDAARLLNLSCPTIYRLIGEGPLSPIRISARSIRIPREQLQALIPESKTPTGNPPDKVISKDEALTRYGISETWLYRKTRSPFVSRFAISAAMKVSL